MGYADEFLPTYDVSDAVAVLVAADTARTWNALMEVDLIEVGRHEPLVGILGGIRMLPEVLSQLAHGRLPPAPPKRMRLIDAADRPAAGGGWTLLGRSDGASIALGLVGKFWRPVIEFADVRAEDFRDFDEPGWAKTIYELSVRDLGGGRTLLEGLMRTATTDERSRRWFKRYWTLGVGSGAHVLAGGVLEQARAAAEQVLVA